MKKISLTLSGHQTSISLEPEFIAILQEIADARHRPMAAIVNEIDATRGKRNLSSAVRVWILKTICNSTL